MRRRYCVFGLLATALSCGNGSLHSTGKGGNSGTSTAGTAGTIGDAGAPGTAGTTGDAGTTGAAGNTGGSGVGGTAGNMPAQCLGPTSPDIVELAILGADGMPVTTAVSAPVTVMSVASCASTTCTTGCALAYCPEVTAGANRITLSGGGPQQWTLYLRDTAMPPDFIKVGDMFDLVVDASLDGSLFAAMNQTVTLSRGGTLLLFAASLRQFGAPPVPNLQAFGVTIADGGIACAPQNCTFARFHDALVTIGSENLLVGNGLTVTRGGLSFTNGAFTEWTSGCVGDPPKSQALMAGFRLP